MRINIQSPSFHASEKLIDFAEDKAGKLAHYSDRIIDVNILLKTDKSDTRDNKLCEIKLSVPGNDLFARKQCASFEEAILNTVEALKQQLVRWKEKV
jgi:putative sigma-54 modulation protein